MKTDQYSFASDNCAGVHPQVMKALLDVNIGYTHAYGEDAVTRQAEKMMQELMGEKCRIFFVYNGTGANVTGISQVIHPYETVYCSDAAHIHVDECGAIERYAGCKVVSIPTSHGKLHRNDVEPLLTGIGDVHRSQPGILSITQPTEYGVVYTVDEIRELSAFAHAYGMLMHVDGARIANAAVALNVSLKEMITESGVDLMSFGAAKNGIMFGEAVVLVNPKIGKAFPFVRKQGMQLHSKMRYISAQFIALLTDDLWLKNAAHANRMAHRLYQGLSHMEQVTVQHPVHCNSVFAVLPEHMIAPMQERYHFYTWDHFRKEVRLMTSFQTREEEVDALLQSLAEAFDYSD